jgi:hypothetical protein
VNWSEGKVLVKYELSVHAVMQFVTVNVLLQIVPNFH